MKRHPRATGIELERTGSLVDRVTALLAAGPLPTDVLASRAMAMRGSPELAARAVWALLGADPRFEVSKAGVWSLAEKLPDPIRRLRDEDWVVVDVETTGGSPDHGHRVTEIAAVRVQRGEVREVISTLVNPERPIPGMITSLTGITNAMVANAPRFAEVAPRFTGFLAGRVFVAHNAPFDWRFVCAELERAAGQRLAGRQLCTVRLARKLLPQLPSRSLDALVSYFALEIAARHRAADDAVATAHLLLRLLDMLEDQGIEDWQGVEALLAKRSPRRQRSVLPRSIDAI